MAVDVCTGISSPRISFSYDDVSDEKSNSQHPVLESNSDFDFCIGKPFVQDLELSSADELFSNGKILPLQFKTRAEAKREQKQIQLVTSLPSLPHPVPKPNAECTEKRLLKEFLSMSFDDDAEEKPPSRSFWKFKRSSSLNCESVRSKGLIRPLQILSRSNSTGSVPNPKQTDFPKDKHNLKPSLHKQPSMSGRKSSASNNAGAYYPYNSSQKPPFKKNYGNGVQVNPVLNLTPHISRGTLSLLGSLFCNSKSKKKKR